MVPFFSFVVIDSPRPIDNILRCEDDLQRIRLLTIYVIYQNYPEKLLRSIKKMLATFFKFNGMFCNQKK